MDWKQKKLLSNWNYQSHPLLGLKIIDTCNKYGSKNKWARSKTFYACIAIKILYQLGKQCKKWLLLYHGKNIVMLKLDCTLPNVTNIFPYKFLDYPITEVDESFWRNFKKMLLVVHVSFLHVKQSLTKIPFGNRKTSADLLFGLMLTNYNNFWCVNPWRPMNISVGILLQKPIDPTFVKTRPRALKIGSYSSFSWQEQIAKMRTSSQQAGTKNWQIQCWWILFSSQQCVWRHGVILLLLSLSRSTSISGRRRYSTW